MRLFFLLLFLLFIQTSLFSQYEDFYEEKITKKEARKLKREKEAELLKQSVKLMVEKKHFVLKANTLTDKRGNVITVDPGINFIMIDSNEAVIQIGSPGSIGYNGVGGVTIEGKVKKYELKELKNSYSIKTLINSLKGSYDVFITIYPSSNATAQVSGVFGGTVSYRGKIEPIKVASVYKGHSY